MTRFWIIFLVLLVTSLLLELLNQPYVVLGPEAIPFFHAWFGFAVGAVIIIMVKVLGILLKRSASYYIGDNDA